MKRCYLRKGDRSTVGGIVVEGMSDSICDGVELTFVGAKINCPACNSVGTIVACGPRLPDNWMGCKLALENDLCACKCYPQPLMKASQTAMFESFEANELASMGFTQDGIAVNARPVVDYWVRFISTESGNLHGIRCAAHFEGGTVEQGVFDSNNVLHFNRSNSSACHRVEFIFEKRAEDRESVTGGLLAMTVGAEQ